MEKIVLSVNIGSSSKKFGLFKNDAMVLRAYAETTKDGYLLSVGDEQRGISEEEYDRVYSLVMGAGVAKGLIGEHAPLSAVGVRVVSPGMFFTEHRIIDDAYISLLKEKAEEDPVHILPVVKEISRLRATYPEVPLVGVSDSAFHRTQPDEAFHYAIPDDSAGQYDVAHFGYHGLSVASIARVLPTLNISHERVIVCHLGSGASVTALFRGKSIDTSMGYAPLEGLLMSSRAGDVGAGAIFHLLRSFSPEALERLLYEESGLRALSGVSSDMREIISAEEVGDVGAERAIRSYVYRIKKYIGAYIAALGGADVIVFSGTIGERSHIIRGKICKELAFSGAILDPEKNASAVSGTTISIPESRVRLLVLSPNEESEILEVVKVALFGRY